jgi:glyoxylase-like metal-dependent hydrolase (beta-lactamase superfamily II)
MTDRPTAMTATWAVLYAGYASLSVAATVGFLRDGDRRVVTDPGMVRHRSLILDPLAALGVAPEEVTDVVLSHHHPDHTLHAALFPNARVHDHWAIYQGNQWQWRDADGYALTAAIKLIRTPGHTPEDITILAGTAQGVVAFTHLWIDAAAEGDRHAVDLEALHAGRRRVLALAELIVPGHGPPFTPDNSTPAETIIAGRGPAPSGA